jgi:hypothetical protein
MATPNDYAFWNSFRTIGVKRLVFCWDFYWAIGFSTVGVYFYTAHIPKVSAHVAVVGDFVALTGALFGVVIAGLAIVATVLDRKYARFIEDARGSVHGLLSHFLVDGGLLLMALTSGIVYRSIATTVAKSNQTIEFCLFGLCVFLFFWALFGAFQILKLVFALANIGAAVLAAPDAEEGNQKAS